MPETSLIGSASLIQYRNLLICCITPLILIFQLQSGQWFEDSHVIVKIYIYMKSEDVFHCI